jgi:hypothetical protein
MSLELGEAYTRTTVRPVDIAGSFDRSDEIADATTQSPRGRGFVAREVSHVARGFPS